jgi:hypothetical protein
MKFIKAEEKYNKWFAMNMALYHEHDALVTEMQFKHQAAEVLLWCQQNLKHDVDVQIQWASRELVELDSNSGEIKRTEADRMVQLHVWMDSLVDSMIFNKHWC